MANMSKKHFEWAAASCRDAGRQLAQAITPTEIKTAKLVLETVVDAYVELFKTFGPRFDEKVFRAACNAF